MLTENDLRAKAKQYIKTLAICIGLVLLVTLFFVVSVLTNQLVWLIGIVACLPVGIFFAFRLLRCREEFYSAVDLAVEVDILKELPTED